MNQPFFRRFLFSLPALSVAILFFCGCETPDPAPIPGFQPGQADRLTRAEREMMIRSAQTFVSNSKSLRLLDEQRRYIRKTRPKVTETYTAPKSGTLELEWRISRGSVLYLKEKGRLIKKKPNWTLEIRTLHESDPVPEGFLKEDLQDLSLPPK